MGLPTLLVLAVMAWGWWIVQKVTHGEPAEAVTSDVAVESSVADTLTLPDGKLKAARFESIPAQNQSVQHTHTVPGRLRYDETKHVDVKAPMDGILAEVQVTPGVLVESGQLLAVLCSPEIGRAQAEAYAKLFAIFRKHEDVIERVTFWGLNDRRTWRFGQHPLIFDSNNHPKPAYAAIVNEPSRD